MANKSEDETPSKFRLYVYGRGNVWRTTEVSTVTSITPRESRVAGPIAAPDADPVAKPHSLEG